ncbi:hypothetical protein CEV34_3044 [Brucella pseudogrignonensis]|uniref:Uncharacterized protein n=1 Tax=Brucella pseudogrignonensis TaxID=419475 RepID=A0A256GFG3_9HYPH|nr:hypothetical protein CEV34_3044 [Brucella pseudogrignonensis]
MEPFYFLFYRIIPRKTASHFCWKCSEQMLDTPILIGVSFFCF